jgi:hypothetical protein
MNNTYHIHITCKGIILNTNLKRKKVKNYFKNRIFIWYSLIVLNVLIPMWVRLCRMANKNDVNLKPKCTYVISMEIMNFYLESRFQISESKTWLIYFIDIMCLYVTLIIQVAGSLVWHPDSDVMVNNKLIILWLIVMWPV